MFGPFTSLLTPACLVSLYSLSLRHSAACPAQSRSFYQHNLLAYMTNKRNEAGHVEPSPETDTPHDPTAEPRLKTPTKQTIYWMFDELDVAPMDRKLSRAEVSDFMNDTVRNVHPRACAETQWQHCDYNEDGYISLSEWCWCNGLDPSKLQSHELVPFLFPIHPAFFETPRESSSNNRVCSL